MKKGKNKGNKNSMKKHKLEGAVGKKKRRKIIHEMEKE